MAVFAHLRVLRWRISSLSGTRLIHRSQCLQITDSEISRIICTGDISSPLSDYNFARNIIDFWARKEQSFERSTKVPALWIVDAKGGASKDVKLSYLELSQMSKRMAGVLRGELGMGKGDRLLICLPKCVDYWVLIVAALRCGIEFSTVTTQATARDFKHRIEKSKPKCIFSDKIIEVDEACKFDECSVRHKISLSSEADTWGKVSTLMKAATDFDGFSTSGEDSAIVFFTSGTTGSPKMVEHVHSYTLAHVLTAKYYYCLNQNDILWCMADTGWAKVAWGTFPTWIYGSCVFVDTTPRFSVVSTLETLRKYPITKLCAPPTVYRQLITEKEKDKFVFNDLIDCVSAGEPLNPEAYHEWKAITGIEIREGYGQTETTLIACTPFGSPVKPGSMGFPIKECQVVVLDDQGNAVKPGEPGQLSISLKPRKPVGLLREYRSDPEKNRGAFQYDCYLTGDKVFQDKSGYLWFVSRSDDVITSSGYRIGPFEIESVLLEHPAVLESAVVGSPDEKRLEVVKAFVVRHDDHRGRDEQELVKELQEFVKVRTAPYKYPRKVEFVDSLPKTMSGKIQRNVLRQKEIEKYNKQ